MRRLNTGAALALCLLPLPAQVWALDIVPADAGTYQVLGPAQEPTQSFLRLSHEGGRWSLASRVGEQDWQAVGCDPNCTLQTASASEAANYLPPALRASHDLACLQSAQYAFCRYSRKNQPEQGGYVALPRVSWKPIPQLLQKIASE